MTIILYDLCGKDDRRFSPNCWRTRLALAHKGVSYETRPTRFTEIADIAPGPRRTLPTIEDDGELVTDSWEIALHLERKFPDRPSLFGGPGGQALSRFVQGWTETILHAGVINSVVKDIHDHLSSEDRSYFRSSREKRFGKPLEEVQAGREDLIGAFRASLAPLRQTLRNQSFLGGGEPLYADYIVMGGFLWARTISSFRLLAEDDPLLPWVDRCLDLHDGLARKHVGYYWQSAA